MKTKIGASKQKYRLLADGTIIDQSTGKTCGYLHGAELDEVWNLPAAAKQGVLRKKVESL